MKKLFIWIVWILAILWVSSAQNITLRLDWDWKYWMWCIVPVDVYANADWQEVDSIDLRILSDFEFIDFIPSKDFLWSYLKPTISWNLVAIWGVLWTNDYNTWYWKIWTLYFNVEDKKLWYVEILFNWQWDMYDTNMYNNNVDVLVFTRWISFWMSENMSWCVHEIISWWLMTLSDDEILSSIQESFNLQKKSRIYIVVSSMYFYLWIIFVVIIILYVYNKKSKWGK